MENEVTEPSISELRVLMNTPAPDQSEAPVTEAPAAEAKAEAKTEPATEPVVTEEAKPAAAAADEAPLPANVQKRIDKAVKAQREAERQRDEALAKPGSQPAKESAPPVAQQGEPDAAKFDTYEAYIKALTTWQLDTRDAQRSAAERDRAAADNYKTREVAAKAKHTDFDEVLAGAASMPISQAMHEAIGEEGPELAYYLATHPEETARVAALSPGAQQRALGVILKSLEAAPAAPAASSNTEKPAAAAKPLPRPPAAVGGSHAPATVDLNDPNLSMRDFKRHVTKLLAA